MSYPAENLLVDPSVLALIRLPVGLTTMVELGPPLEQMAKLRGGEARLGREGEWLVIRSTPAPIKNKEEK